MDAETQAHIFEPFFTTKEMGKGTGLGLSTVCRSVKQHKGMVWVYSEVGLGTEFKIYLPSCRGDEDRSAASSSPIEVAGGSETIVIVEDEVSQRLRAPLDVQKPLNLRVLVEQIRLSLAHAREHVEG